MELGPRLAPLAKFSLLGVSAAEFLETRLCLSGQA